MALPIRPTLQAVRKFAVAQAQCRFYSAPTDGSIPAAKQRFVSNEGIYPKGFVVGSAHAGVKPSNTTRDDVAIVASEELCAAATFFTKNKFAAPPVTVSRNIVRKRKGSGLQGVVINSGCANAVTGKDGFADALSMSRAMDDLFGGQTESDGQIQGNDDASLGRSLVMSTGVIGQRLPIDKILSTIPKIKSKLGSSHEHWLSVAKAVMTTDTFPKLVSRQFTLPSDPNTTYTLAGFSKGAGMIHPNMATMLSVICTDVRILPAQLQEAGKDAVNESFNSITIDGDTSTNDSLAIFANGAATPPSSNGIEEFKGPDFKHFRKELKALAADLAKLVVLDGEGATKFVTIRVKAASVADGRIVGRSIAVSPLVKTALYGKDANWGRILCAIGNVRNPVIDPSSVSVSFDIPGTKSGHLSLVEKGRPQLPIDEAVAKQILDEEAVTINVDLISDSSVEGFYSTVWTCDLSHEYITINGDYRT
ncbi:arginine biosynthesis protein ArgJ [Myriangium duriaei CBS 260.36]|uniref:Arginine biosynthesis bifunctional protein ArgJ, mitochondrial n=1 Tax=Myriangium duriaei CBS 260.36 TaxID=1168546 RepID=A0A9P4JB01_9PEZI|nr:arginine biosynthesis protein ArgJ [Myriangium duriaei CBS 260.36]